MKRYFPVAKTVKNHWPPSWWGRNSLPLHKNSTLPQPLALQTLGCDPRTAATLPWKWPASKFLNVCAGLGPADDLGQSNCNAYRYSIFYGDSLQRISNLHRVCYKSVCVVDTSWRSRWCRSVLRMTSSKFAKTNRLIKNIRHLWPNFFLCHMTVGPLK